MLELVEELPSFMMESPHVNQTPLSESKRVSFNLGFFLGIIGAVVSATLIYAKFSGSLDVLKEQVTHLENANYQQQQELQKITMDFKLFLQKYDQDMNRYVRDRREITGSR